MDASTLMLEDPNVAAGVGLLVGATAVVLGVLGVIWYFVSSIGFFKVYQKAGEAGWKAFIPVLRMYPRFKMAWCTRMFWIYMVLYAAMSLLGNMEEQGFVLSIISLVVAAAVFVIAFKLDLRLAKSFGKGTGFGVLLFFFPFIVSLILGFGKAEYVGNPCAPACSAAAEEE